MCIQISFGHSDEELAAAEWSVVEALEQAVKDGLPQSQSRQALQQALDQTRRRAATPQQWANTLAANLAQVLGQLGQAQDTARELERARWKLDYYQRVTDQHARDPLQAQVNKLTGERDRWQAQAEDLAQRVETLERTITQAQQSHSRQADQLKADVASLNRIVREQQDQINNAASL